MLDFPDFVYENLSANLNSFDIRCDPYQLILHQVVVRYPHIRAKRQYYPHYSSIRCHLHLIQEHINLLHSILIADKYYVIVIQR